MLNDSPVVRSAGPRILFLVSAVVSAVILLWMHHLRVHGDLSGLTPLFYVLFAYEDYYSTVGALLILGAAVFVASRISAHSVLSAAGARPMLIVTLSALVLAAGALFVYHDHPLSPDEYAAYFQSRIFAHGRLTGQLPVAQLDWLLPPGPKSILIAVSPTDGRVASSYWPAQALILAPFSALGIPWACNPLLSALTAGVIHRLAVRIFESTEAAGLALLLTVASPVFFGVGISYDSMAAQLFCNSLYALLLVRPTARRVLLAGLVGSVALWLHDPVPHLLFAAPWLIWIATRPGGVRLFALLGLGYLPLCLMLGVGWFELIHHLGIATALPILSPPTATVLLARIIGLAKAWVWTVPGLLVLGVCGAVRGRQHRPCMLLAASAVVTLAGSVCLPSDQGHGWGDRSLHSTWMALLLLATAAIYRLPGPKDSPGDSAPTPPGVFADPATKSYVAACILLTLVFGTGFRAWEMQRFMSAVLSQLPHYAGVGRQVVILDVNPIFGFQLGDLVQNDPFMRDKVIRMMSHGRAEDRQLMAQYYPNLHLVSANHFGWVWAEQGAAVGAATY